ncbi:tripartite tricarboxylate transporter substrate binding protein [Achromobacter seleniivolatilans]|uniref:Tripartite tricarboxylate transporter substrate binding protein n=1 Tax=Achromobacter seleniivolatilans TaxID=3047478 RepID=A0ABY9LXY7_9BURK|nr:tripartite tricarboxylate transporter substrate binding protein [Achromobacter sp. R39]WMD19634.1 tripartite tricarboxylate transporter substrate binding protein [Achromobacter sp. R39]
MIRSILASISLGVVCMGAPQAAPVYPDKPITLLIPYPPGGSADMLARPLSAELQKKWGQPVVLEYKPGAGGAIASSQLARAKPDGYTLLMVLAAHAINPSLYPSLPYDTRKDFAPVSLVATLPMLVAAPLSTPANTIPELIAYGKSHPGKLSFASAGNGNTSHLAAEMFKNQTGTDMMHVPYKGSGPAVVALLSGEVSLMFDSISTSLPQVQAGKLKAIAVTGDRRSPLLPDVPTVAESVPGFVVNGWYGVLAPAGTPSAVVDALSRGIAEAVSVPGVRGQLAGYGYEVVGSTAAEFSGHIDRELEAWKRAVEASGARLN